MDLGTCSSFISKWFEFVRSQGEDPETSIQSWNDFLNAGDVGVISYMDEYSNDQPNTVEEVVALFQGAVAAKGVEWILTPEETVFLTAIYMRKFFDNDREFSCEWINEILSKSVEELQNYQEDEDVEEQEEQPTAQPMMQTPIVARPSIPGFTAPSAALFNPLQATQLSGTRPATVITPSPASQYMASFTQSQQQQPTMPVPIASGHDLPYVNVSVRGIKPGNKSKLVMLNLKDNELGDLRISVFITAGNVPTEVNHTFFQSEGKLSSDNRQKASIHAQNATTLKNLEANKTGIPMMSDGNKPDGVVAQKIYAYNLVPVKITDYDKYTGQPNVPRSSGAGDDQPMSAPPSGSFTSGPPSGSFPSGPASSGRLPSGPIAPGPPIVGMAMPPGTMEIPVRDIRNHKKIGMTTAYQVPGGPRPIAVGKASDGSIKIWFIMPNGDFAFSKSLFVRAGDKFENRKPGKAEEASLNQVKAELMASGGLNLPASQPMIQPSPPASGTRPSTVATMPAATPIRPSGFGGLPSYQPTVPAPVVIQATPIAGPTISTDNPMQNLINRTPMAPSATPGQPGSLAQLLQLSRPN